MMDIWARSQKLIYLVDLFAFAFVFGRLFLRVVALEDRDTALSFVPRGVVGLPRNSKRHRGDNVCLWTGRTNFCRKD